MSLGTIKASYLILTELRCYFFNGFVFRFRNFEPHVNNEQDLHDDEDDEDIGTKGKLQK